MRSIIRLLLVSALCGMFAAPVAAADARQVRGTVVDTDSKPIKGAVVQLKSLQTLAIRSFIAQEGGKFLFTGLSPDMDYEVRARYQDQWSSAKSVSRFDSSQTVEIVLTVELKTATK